MGSRMDPIGQNGNEGLHYKYIKPENPKEYDSYVNLSTEQVFVYLNNEWVIMIEEEL